MKQGKFITFEGGEGAGKTTQIKHLRDYLQAQGLRVLITREPGGSLGAEKIRDLIVRGDVNQWDGLTEALLFQAARRDHLVRVIWPTLQKGEWVLCDRFQDSTLAYQGYGHALDLTILKKLYTIIAGDFKPDLILFLDLPAEVGLTRARARHMGEDRFEHFELDFHTKVRTGFHELASQDLERYKLIQANHPVDTVAEEIKTVVAKKFNLK